jgi:hypothetical protein
MNEYKIGDKVKILDPFGDHFPEIYTISEIHDEFIRLEEHESAFDYIFIERA